MHAISRRLGLVLASTAAVCGLSVLAPATASAATASVASVSAEAGPRCRPAHWGRDWRWDDGRRGGHWDHREWNRRAHRWEWKHQWRDNRYCAQRSNGNGHRNGHGNGHGGRDR